MLFVHCTRCVLHVTRDNEAARTSYRGCGRRRQRDGCRIVINLIARSTSHPGRSPSRARSEPRTRAEKSVHTPERWPAVSHVFIRGYSVPPRSQLPMIKRKQITAWEMLTIYRTGPRRYRSERGGRRRQTSRGNKFPSRYAIVFTGHLPVPGFAS